MAPFNLPIRESEKFVGYVNVITETGNRWQGKEVVSCEVSLPIPEVVPDR